MILDASVAVKWFLLDEALLTEAMVVRTAMLQQRVRLSAPSIMRAELAHAVIRAVRRDRLQPDRARELADEILDVVELVEAVAVDPRGTITTALRVGVGAYDAQYLDLGARLASTVITADRRLWERGRAHGYDLTWLGDISIVDGVLVDTP